MVRKFRKIRKNLFVCLSIGELKEIMNEAQESLNFSRSFVFEGEVTALKEKKYLVGNQPASDEVFSRAVELLGGGEGNYKVNQRTISFSDLNAMKDEGEEEDDHEIQVPYLQSDN